MGGQRNKKNRNKKEKAGEPSEQGDMDVDGPNIMMGGSGQGPLGASGEDVAASSHSVNPNFNCPSDLGDTENCVDSRASLSKQGRATVFGQDSDKGPAPMVPQRAQEAAAINPHDLLSVIREGFQSLKGEIKGINTSLDMLWIDHEALKKKTFEEQRNPQEMAKVESQIQMASSTRTEPMEVPDLAASRMTTRSKTNHQAAKFDNASKQDFFRDPSPEPAQNMLQQVQGLLSVVEDMVKYNNPFLSTCIMQDFQYMQSEVVDIPFQKISSSNDRKTLMHKLERYEKQLQSMIEDITVRNGVRKYVDKGAVFVGRGVELDHFLRTKPDVKVYVFAFKWENMEALVDLWELFDNLLEFQNKVESSATLCALLDLEEHKKISGPDCIRTFFNGDCICRDLLAEMHQIGRLCTAHAYKYEDRSKPDKKTYFEVHCPLAFKKESKCPKKNVSWLCSKCLSQLEYGFDGYLYCNCGAGKVENFCFRCNSEGHGLKHEFFEKRVIADVVNGLRSFNGLTILILGETGVGKSTFINGFANYLQYDTLKEAQNGDTLLSPVKSSFVMTDENFELTTVTTGSEENECQIVGQSATQGTKAHVFNYKGAVDVRLIDTPGIGDTRGIEQDKENFQNILSYISYFEEIHGICILLKPNNSRLTVMFEFCIKELLTHLHKNAADNIVFCFTNARNTNYRPGDTFPALKKLLDENENVQLPLTKETVFCMDNESFRYLAAVKHGIAFGEEDDRVYGASWERATAETNRMMKYISGLKAHKVKDTISINDVRRKILDLTKPLAEIAKHIDTTISNIEDHKKEIESTEKSASEIFKMINIQVPMLERRTLPYPRTVCTSLNCSETHNLNGQDVKKFNIHCHEHCYLTGVQADIVNNPDLKNCSAMSASRGQSCSKCRCGWEVHMHVTYELVSVFQAGEDKSAKQRYEGITDRIKLKERALADFRNVVHELESEKQEIIKASAQFGMFLKTNSVIPYNDAMIAYLNLMIKMETEKAGQTQDYSLVDTLHVLKQRYQHEIDIIKTATSAGTGEIILSAQDQNDIMKRLFQLKHFGQNMETILLQMENEKYRKVTFEESRYEVKHQSIVGIVKSKCWDAIHYVFSSISSRRSRLPALEASGRGGGKSYQPLTYEEEKNSKATRNGRNECKGRGRGKGKEPWRY